MPADLTIDWRLTVILALLAYTWGRHRSMYLLEQVVEHTLNRRDSRRPPAERLRELDDTPRERGRRD